jgi:hypothetical protein
MNDTTYTSITKKVSEHYNAVACHILTMSQATFSSSFDYTAPTGYDEEHLLGSGCMINIGLQKGTGRYMVSIYDVNNDIIGEGVGVADLNEAKVIAYRSAMVSLFIKEKVYIDIFPDKSGLEDLRNDLLQAIGDHIGYKDYVTYNNFVDGIVQVLMKRSDFIPFDEACSKVDGYLNKVLGCVNLFHNK